MKQIVPSLYSVTILAFSIWNLTLAIQYPPMLFDNISSINSNNGQMIEPVNCITIPLRLGISICVFNSGISPTIINVKWPMTVFLSSFKTEAVIIFGGPR
jgi:hypothetical protein